MLINKEDIHLCMGVIVTYINLQLQNLTGRVPETLNAFKIITLWEPGYSD
jgi:hypothetical protein